MNIKLKKSLHDTLQLWLESDEVHNNLIDLHGLYQDGSLSERTADVLTNAVEVVIDGMEHQSQLIRENEGS